MTFSFTLFVASFTFITGITASLFLSLYISLELNGDDSIWRYYEIEEVVFQTIEVSTGVSYDVWPPANNYYGSEDVIQDCGQDGYCWNFNASNQDAPQVATDIWGNPMAADNGNWIIIDGPDYGENDGVLALFDFGELNDVFDSGDGLYGADAEPYIDVNKNGYYDCNNPEDPTN